MNAYQLIRIWFNFQQVGADMPCLDGGDLMDSGGDSQVVISLKKIA